MGQLWIRQRSQIIGSRIEPQSIKLALQMEQRRRKCRQPSRDIRIDRECNRAGKRQLEEDITFARPEPGDLGFENVEVICPRNSIRPLHPGMRCSRDTFYTWRCASRSDCHCQCITWFIVRKLIRFRRAGIPDTLRNFAHPMPIAQRQIVEAGRRAALRRYRDTGRIFIANRPYRTVRDAHPNRTCRRRRLIHPECGIDAYRFRRNGCRQQH